MILFILSLLFLNAKIAASVQMHGLVNLKKTAIEKMIDYSTVEKTDSADLSYRTFILLQTGLFDTLYFRQMPSAVGTNTLHLVTKEKKRYEAGFKGANAGLTMFGKTQLWAAITPGLEIRNIAGRTQALSVLLTFPFIYSTTAHWREYGLPFRTMTTGILASIASFPYINSPYYQKAVTGMLYINNQFTKELSIRASATEEISRTWKIKTGLWMDDRLAVLKMDPESVRDTSSRFFPRTEEAPSFALSGSLDKRDSDLLPTKGFHLFIEGRHCIVSQRAREYSFAFNQATAFLRAYFSPIEKQVAAVYIKGIVRDSFDPDRLSHRLIFHDETQSFLGFNGIAGTNLLIGYMEYRYLLFKVNMRELTPELQLSPKITKELNKMSYQGHLLAFFNNGAYFGRVFTGTKKDIPFTSISIDDLFSSVGIGGRLIYPDMGYAFTGALTLWARGPADLPSSNFTRLYAAASLSF